MLILKKALSWIFIFKVLNFLHFEPDKKKWLHTFYLATFLWMVYILYGVRQWDPLPTFLFCCMWKLYFVAWIWKYERYESARNFYWHNFQLIQHFVWKKVKNHVHKVKILIVFAWISRLKVNYNKPKLNGQVKMM